ncbi:MAG: Superoxide dismutase [Mn] 1 [Chlamydiia bacterium]|nr:Superoxide dismutase [Mn] 1 [Chlamydiia bacterium]
MDWEFKELGYDFDALEPYIDAQTMEIHYTKHYKAYHTKALSALSGDTSKSVEEVLLTDLRPAVQNNGGGFFNHTIFWEILGKNNGEGPSGNVGALIDKAFGSFDVFKEKFAEAGATLFGSGWVFLVYDEKSDELEIIQRHNQDHPLCGKKILMGLDVWEHAYYLNYQNKRPDYIKAFWEVVDWKKVENRFLTEKTFVLV